MCPLNEDMTLPAFDDKTPALRGGYLPFGGYAYVLLRPGYWLYISAALWYLCMILYLGRLYFSFSKEMLALLHGTTYGWLWCV